MSYYFLKTKHFSVSKIICDGRGKDTKNGTVSFKTERMVTLTLTRIEMCVLLIININGHLI